MAPDPIIYCLENLTDYDQFERLCHDVMTLDGYRGIEPLGGRKDKGRDALHTSASGVRTIFAYSVREDWRDKLDEDAAKIHGHKHPIDRLTFLSTGVFTASERDSAVADIKKTYGWTLELYGLERLSGMLRTTHKQVVADHPQIFCPPFFPTAGGLSLTSSSDHVIVDHADADTAVAHWLYRRLTLLGYKAWVRGLAPLAGTSVDATVRSLIEARAFRYITFWSSESIADADLNARRQFAQLLGRQRQQALVIPAQVGAIDKSNLDSEARQMVVARFDEGWAHGLRQVEEVLRSANCPRTPSGTRDIVLQSLGLPEIVRIVPERLASNVFRVARFPEVIRRYESALPLSEHDSYLDQWAFRRVDSKTALCLQRPPAEIVQRFGLEERGAATWSADPEIDGINTENLLIELIKKALRVECLRRGLCYRNDRRHVYFPPDVLPNDNLRFERLDGSSTYFSVVGQRTHRGVAFRHHLSPSFFVKGRPQRGFDIILRLHVHLTDVNGHELPGKQVNTRRKKVCRNWWNHHWLYRTLGVMQFLATEPGVIRIGSRSDELLEIESRPQFWDIAVSINEDALAKDQEPDDDLPDSSVDDEEDDDDEGD